MSPPTHSTDLQTPWLEALIHRAVDRVLNLDPHTAERLRELGGKLILIELAAEGSPIRLYIQPIDAGLRFLRDADRVPDVTISGTPGVFLAQLTRGFAVSDALTIRGDVELGRRFQRVLAGLDPDWEEGLARIVGDIPAHQALRFARTTRAWIKHALDVLVQDSAEYLKEEAMILAKRERVAEFMHAVDRARDDVDRLEKRLRQLSASS